MFAWVSPSGYVSDAVKDKYKGIEQFAGPAGDQVMSWVDAPVRGNWSFMITKNDKNPVETIKWVDFWYSEAGFTMFNYGEEGVTFTKDSSGTYVWTGDAKTANDAGTIYNILGHYGGFEPGISHMAVSADTQKIVDDLNVKNGIKQTPSVVFSLDDPTDYQKVLPKEIWSAFLPTSDEAEQLAAITPDMQTYLDQMRVKFITGTADITKEWDAYKATLDKMGAAKYLTIKQAEYDRYKAS